MSGGNCPETPRQKMIGMMYLFLTALLALNVSKEILNAFIVVNDSLEETNSTFDGKNSFIYNSFANQMAIYPDRVKPYYEAANQVKDHAKKMSDYIDLLKLEVISAAEFGLSTDEQYEQKVIDILDYEYQMQIEQLEAEGLNANSINRDNITTVNMKHIGSKDNYDVPTYYFCGQTVDGTQGKGTELKHALEDYRKNLVNLISSVDFVGKTEYLKDIQQSKLGIDTNDPIDIDSSNTSYYSDHPEEKYWISSKFYNMPLAATVTMLSQIQNSVKNAETEIISKLIRSVGSDVIPFDTVAAKIIPRSNYLIQGDDYSANLFMAAFSTKDKPIITIGSGYDTINKRLLPPIDTLPVEKGLGNLFFGSPAIGQHSFSAQIQVKKPDGSQLIMPVMVDDSYDINYTVAPPSAVVSPTAMNVLYIGVDNPIEISVPGFSKENTRATISNGTLYPNGVGFIAKPASVGRSYITVSVIDDNGNSRQMGQKEFRVKKIPKPEAIVLAKSKGRISIRHLKADPNVKVKLDNFLFNVTFRVKSFTLTFQDNDDFFPSYNHSGGRIRTDVLNRLDRINRNNKIFFEKIIVVGPGNVEYELNDLIFKKQ